MLYRLTGVTGLPPAPLGPATAGAQLEHSCTARGAQFDTAPTTTTHSLPVQTGLPLWDGFVKLLHRWF